MTLSGQFVFQRRGLILDTHYLNRDPALGESAIRKLEQGTKTPNWSAMF